MVQDWTLLQCYRAQPTVMSVVDHSSRRNLKDLRRASGTISTTSYPSVVKESGQEHRRSSIQRSASTSPPPLGPSTQINHAQNRRATSKGYPGIHQLIGEEAENAQEETDDVATPSAPKLVRSASINATVPQHNVGGAQSSSARRPQAVRSASGSAGGSDGMAIEITSSSDDDIVLPHRAPAVLSKSPVYAAASLSDTMGGGQDILPVNAAYHAVDGSTRSASFENGRDLDLSQPGTLMKQPVTQQSAEPEFTSMMQNLSLQNPSAIVGPAETLHLNNAAFQSIYHPDSINVNERSPTTIQMPVAGHSGQQSMYGERMYAAPMTMSAGQGAHQQLSKGPDSPEEYYLPSGYITPQHGAMMSQRPYDLDVRYAETNFAMGDSSTRFTSKTNRPHDLRFHPSPSHYIDGRQNAERAHHPASSVFNGMPPPQPVNSNITLAGPPLSLSHSPYMEHLIFDPRQAAPPISASPMFGVIPPTASFDPNAGRLAMATPLVSQQYMPQPVSYRGTIPHPPLAYQGVPDFNAHSPTMIHAPPLDPSQHSRHPSITTQGSITPPFTPSAWQRPHPNVAQYPSYPTTRQGSMGSGMSPQPWRGGVGRGGVKVPHRRMQSGPVYAPTTPIMSPQFPIAVDRMPTANRTGMHTRSSSSLSYASLLGSSNVTQDVHPNRSRLLEEFRAMHNRGKTYELQDIRGAVVEFSMDQHGSRFTQERLVGAPKEVVKMVFDEVLPQANVLMIDVFGNYVVQKLIEHGTADMQRSLLSCMKGRVRELSLSTYGCRVVQRMLDCVEQAARLEIANELREGIEHFVCDQNANHVVQKILERSDPISDVNFIAKVFSGNVKRLASHCYSCRVLQRIFEYCGESEKRPLMEEMLLDIQDLMQDRYGNYVVQWVLREGLQKDKESVIASIKGDLLRLSMAKCASNVVEKAIQCANEQDRFDLIEETMLPAAQTDKDTAAPPILALDVMMKDQFGNYVLQCCISHATGEQSQRLLVATKRALKELRQKSGLGTNSRHLNAIQRLIDARTSHDVNDATSG